MSTESNDQSVQQTTADQIPVSYPSGELLLSIIQKEYDYETTRKTAFETRAGIFIPFVAAILTFVVSYIKVDTLKKNKVEFAIQAIYYSVYGLLGIAAIGLLVTALVYFIKVMLASRYERLELSDISDKHGKYSKDALAMAYAEKYRDIIEINHKLNGIKALHYQRGCYATFAAILTTILVYGISQNL